MPDVKEPFDLSLARVKEQAKQLSGWMTPDEISCLYKLGYESNYDTIEIGTYCGKSTFAIASGIRDAGKNHLLITIDIHREKGTDQILLEDRICEVCKMIRHFEFDRRIIQVIGWSDQCLKVIDFDKIGAVFIDGDHQEEGCKSDFFTIMERVKQHKIRLLFHDFTSFPGVKKTIEAHVKTDPKMSFVKLAGSIYVCDYRKES